MAIKDLQERLRAKFTRRHSTASTTSGEGEIHRSLKSRGSHHPPSTFGGATIDEKDGHGVLDHELSGVEEDGDGAELNQGSSDQRDAEVEVEPQSHLLVNKF